MGGVVFHFVPLMMIVPESLWQRTAHDFQQGALAGAVFSIIAQTCPPSRLKLICDMPAHPRRLY
jgi:hypothetical protein